jgi:hypothetical protein
MKAVWILFILTLLGLHACGYTVDGLAEDDETRHQILKECADMGVASKGEEMCQIAARAQVEAAKRSIKGAFD